MAQWSYHPRRNGQPNRGRLRRQELPVNRAIWYPTSWLQMSLIVLSQDLIEALLNLLCGRRADSTVLGVLPISSAMVQSS